MKCTYQKKGLKIISLIVLLLIIIPISYQSAPINKTTMNNVNADLTFLILETWWSNISKGTLYVRYLTINNGESYHNPYEIVSLNITITIDQNEKPLAYINQIPFFDPHTWYHNETLGGCVQIKCPIKPNNITAHINYFQTIPESNYENNHKNTTIFYGIQISGTITLNNYFQKDYSNVIIKEYNETTLQSSLYILYNASKTGSYTISLYPKKPFDKKHSYHLIFTNKETSISQIKETKPIFKNENITLNITLANNLLPTPQKLLGLPIGFQNKSSYYITYMKKYENEISFKIKWGTNRYSQWLKPSFYNNFLVTSYRWEFRGLQKIKVIAKDENGTLSNWSKPTNIYILPRL